MRPSSSRGAKALRYRSKTYSTLGALTSPRLDSTRLPTGDSPTARIEPTSPELPFLEPTALRAGPKSRIVVLAMKKPGTPVQSSFPKAALLDVEPGRFRYSIWSNVTISVWADQADLAAAQRVLAISKRVVQERPEGHSTVIFVLTGVPAPTAEAAALFANLYDPRNSKISCMAVVLEGEGFWASVMRSTFTRLRLAGGGALTFRVCENIEQVVDWLPREHAVRTGVQLDPAQLSGALHAARASATDGG